MKKIQDSSRILSLRKLCIQRGKTQILKNIDWTINKGEHWAILGPNASGKSSLLSALMAYFIPSSGTIELLGQTFGQSNWTEMRNKIGMVSSNMTRKIPSDELAIETVLSGERSQLGFWSKENTLPINKAYSCMEKIGVKHLSQRAWGLLSQGERQKVFIARALMNHPELLILDESCAGLDPVARKGFLNQVSQLCKQNESMSLIFVTHHIEEIVEEISHVILLKEGEVFKSGEKEKILNDKNLSQTFDAQIRLKKDSQNSYEMKIL